MPDTSTRLPGHGLYAEGKACDPDQHYAYMMTGEKTGRGLCSCGEQSPVLDSDNARRRWHREVHKPEVREKMRNGGNGG